jgi:uncharacterized protein
MKFFPSNYTYFFRINANNTIINNLLTGAVDIVDNDIIDRMLGDSFSDLKIGTDPLPALIERGYYYLNEPDEEKLFNELFNNFRVKLKDRPIKIVFCPSYICNLKCTYCFEKNLFKNTNKFLNRNQLKLAFNAVKKITSAKKKIGTIELFGGEPLLPRTKESVKEILEFARKNKIRISIITNGVNAKDYTQLLEPFKSLIDMLQITLDGPEPIHDKRRKFHSGKGSFKDIVDSINTLLDSNINTNIRVNLDMENIESLPELYGFVKNKNWLEHPNFKIQLSKVTDHSSPVKEFPIAEDHVLLERLAQIYDSNPELEELFKFYLFKPLRHLLDITNGAENVSPKYFNCEANLIEHYIFCPDGHIYTCPESIGNKESAIGIFDPAFELFDSGKSVWEERSVMTIEQCRTCKFAPICGGGCPYESILKYKDSSHPSCENFQMVLDTFLRLRGEKILKKFI